MTVPQIHEYLEYISSKRSSFFKAKIYNVQFDNYQFSIRKIGGGQNGLTYPLIKGELTQGEYLHVGLEIKPSYFFIAFCAMFPCVFLPVILLADEMTINGVYRTPSAAERILFSLFSVALPTVLCYFTTIGPVNDAEKWLVKKFKLLPL